MSKVSQIIVVLVFSLSFTGVVFAENKGIREVVVEEVGPMLQVSEEVSPPSLKMLFDQAMVNLGFGQIEKAKESFVSLRQRGIEEGYQNLSEFSISLIEQAKLYRDKPDFVEFLMLSAVDLSPKDPGVYFACAGEYKLIGFGNAFSFLSKAVSLSYKNPLTIAAFFRNTALILLVAGTFAILVACLFYLIFYRTKLIKSFAAIFPANLRIALTPIILYFSLLGPIFVGIFVVLAVWSAILDRFVFRSYRLTKISAVLIICWALVIPLCYRIDLNVNSPISWAISRIKNHSYVQNDLEILKGYKTNGQANLVSEVAKGIVLYRNSEFVEAGNTFRQTLMLGDDSSSVEIAILNNIAAVRLKEGDLGGAKEILLQALAKEDQAQFSILPETRSFELHYNLAQVYLKLLDTQEHRNQYNLATNIDKQKMFELEKWENLKHEPLLADLSGYYYYLNVLRLPAGLDQQKLETFNAAQGKLYKLGIYKGNGIMLIIWGIIIYIISEYLKFLRVEIKLKQLHFGKALTGVVLLFCIVFTSLSSPVRLLSGFQRLNVNDQLWIQDK